MKLDAIQKGVGITFIFIMLCFSYMAVTATKAAPVVVVADDGKLFEIKISKPRQIRENVNPDRNKTDESGATTLAYYPPRYVMREVRDIYCAPYKKTENN